MSVGDAVDATVAQIDRYIRDPLALCRAGDGVEAP